MRAGAALWLPRVSLTPAAEHHVWLDALPALALCSRLPPSEAGTLIPTPNVQMRKLGSGRPTVRPRPQSGGQSRSIQPRCASSEVQASTPRSGAGWASGGSAHRAVQAGDPGEGGPRQVLQSALGPAPMPGMRVFCWAKPAPGQADRAPGDSARAWIIYTLCKHARGRLLWNALLFPARLQPLHSQAAAAINVSAAVRGQKLGPPRAVAQEPA